MRDVVGMGMGAQDVGWGDAPFLGAAQERLQRGP